MLEIEISGGKSLNLKYLVLDYNGTLAVDGNLINGVREKLIELSNVFSIFIVTADTFVNVNKSLVDVKCDIKILQKDKQDYQKLDFINKLGANFCLGRKHHVLCISHLPQIASFADSHYKVEKSVIDGRTYSKIINLDNEMRTEEIARMLGGTKGASDHAKELLKNK